MDKAYTTLKFIFYISLLLLIVVSLFPGSILGAFFYGDISKIPETGFSVETTLNHLLSYICVSFLGFFIYLNTNKFKTLVYFIFFLSFILEFLQIFIPNRSFEISDLFANLAGVLIGYLIIKIFKLWRKK